MPLLILGGSKGTLHPQLSVVYLESVPIMVTSWTLTQNLDALMHRVGLLAADIPELVDHLVSCYSISVITRCDFSYAYKLSLKSVAAKHV